MRRKSTLQLFGSVQLVALFGDRLKQFTLVGMLGLLVPGSSFELLKLTLFSQVPILLFTPLVGSLIDRWNKPATITDGRCYRTDFVYGASGASSGQLLTATRPAPRTS